MDIVHIITPYIDDIVVIILGVVGAYLGKVTHKYLNTTTKMKVAETVVHAVEQLYEDLDGKDKYDKAVDMFVKELGKKGVKMDEDQIKTIIEAAVGKMKLKFSENK